MDVLWNFLERQKWKEKEFTIVRTVHRELVCGKHSRMILKLKERIMTKKGLHNTIV